MSQRLLLSETKKLHYGKYLYKLRLYNQLASIFRTEQQRNGKLSYAKSRLTEYYAQLERGETVTRSRWRFEEPIDPNHIHEAKWIYSYLKSHNEYLVRCEYSTLMIYTNNKLLLDKIIAKTPSAHPELWQPDPENIAFLQANQNVILVDKPTSFPYKLTFGRKPASPSLAKWIESNGDKVSAGKIMMENLRSSNRWIQGQYIYARDENVIMLIQMMVGDNISRIDKLVYKEDIDK